MRVSSYVIGAPLSDAKSAILLHGLTGALDKVPASIARFLVQNRGCELENSTAGLSDNSIFQLRERGYLTDLSLESERDLLVRIASTLHENDLATSPAGFMFVPTYQCNLRCPYCFQPHEMHSGRGRYRTLLDRAGVDHAFQVIENLLTPGAMARLLGLLPEESNPRREAENRPSAIGLFGGEPLMRDTLPVVEYIVAQCIARRWDVAAISNGVELDAFRHLLGPGMIRELQITIDGMPEQHDSRRIGPAHRTTFNRIVSNIDLALELGVEISLRMNIDTSNLGQLRPLWDFFGQRGWTRHPNFRANAAAVTPEGAHKPLLELAELARETTELNRGGTCQIYSYERYAETTLANCLKNEGYPFKRVANCSAETGLLMFDPLGDVYACWEDIGLEDRKIGTYDEHGLKLVGQTAAAWLTRFPGAIEQCTRCPYALIHNSGCANHARNLNGTIAASACESFQEYFPATLANCYDDFERRLLGKPAGTNQAIEGFSEVLASGKKSQGLFYRSLVQIEPARPAVSAGCAH